MRLDGPATDGKGLGDLPGSAADGGQARNLPLARGQPRGPRPGARLRRHRTRLALPGHLQQEGGLEQHLPGVRAGRRRGRQAHRPAGAGCTR